MSAKLEKYAMPPPNSRKRLLELLQGKPAPWAERNSQKTRDEFIQHAKREGVLALATHLLINGDGWAELPEEFRNRLRKEARHAIALELIRQQEIIRVLDLVAAERIRPLLLKGTPLAYLRYPEPHLRTRCDSDLLFPDRATAERAYEILQESGYQRPHAVSGELVSYQFTCHSANKGGMNHAFDLHWRINNQQYLARIFDFGVLEASAQAVPALGENARTLSTKHALLHACAHRLAHQPEGMHNRLIWLYDIHLMAQSLDTTQLEELLKTAKEWQLLEATLDGLRQTQALIGTQLPAHLSQQANTRQSSGQEPFTPRSTTSSWRNEIANFRGIADWHGRVTWLREHLFPPADYMYHKYQTTRRSVLPFLYVKRLINGVTRRF